VDAELLHPKEGKETGVVTHGQSPAAAREGELRQPKPGPVKGFLRYSPYLFFALLIEPGNFHDILSS
jgi:hypothetical protein